jgi:hypothetical protein
MSLFMQLAKIRGMVSSLEKDKKGHTNSYVPLPNILEMINPILAEMEVACLIHTPCYKMENDIRVYNFQVILAHETEKETLEFWIPEAVVPSGKKGKDGEQLDDSEINSRGKAKAIQNSGATLTYSQRYIYHVIFGIPLDEEDPDGGDSTGNVLESDLDWWFKTVPSHEKAKQFTGKMLALQFKMFLKGQSNKLTYEKMGIV